MKDHKFLYIHEGTDSGTLLAQDGGIATIWHNGKHIIGQCYRERLDVDQLMKGINEALEDIFNNSSNSSMLDFEGQDYILPSQLEELADWLICPRQGEFIDNLIYLDNSKMNNAEINAEIIQFFDNEYFYHTEGQE